MSSTEPRRANATAGAPFTQQQEVYDRSFHELYSIAAMVTHKPASPIVLKHDDATGTSEDGGKTREERQEKYRNITDDEITRAKTAKLAAPTTMPWSTSW